MNRVTPQRLQKKLYTRLLEVLYKAKCGHIGSCLSCLDILTQTLVFEMKPSDRFVLSKGHAAPSLYVVLNHLGKISDRELETFHQDGTRLPDHPPDHFKEVIPFETGSLGHGLSLSCGIAQAMRYQAKKKKRVPRVYCMISDGECNEGQVWEAAQYASQNQLQNLIVLIDKNRLQAFGRIDSVLGDGATREKWEAFGFGVYECPGHELRKIKSVYKDIRADRKKAPKVVIFHTIKGQGVSFMEDTLEWHYWPMTDRHYKKAVSEVKRRYEK